MVNFASRETTHSACIDMFAISSCIVYTNARITQSALFGFNDCTYRGSAMTATATMTMTMTMPGSGDGKQRSFPDKRLRIGSWKFIKASCTRAKINRPIAIAFMQIIWLPLLYIDMQTDTLQIYMKTFTRSCFTCSCARTLVNLFLRGSRKNFTVNILITRDFYRRVCSQARALRRRD